MSRPLPDEAVSPVRIRATYLLVCAPGEEPGEKARDVAWEQTVELGPGSVAAEVEERAVGRVESLEAVEESPASPVGLATFTRGGGGAGSRFRAVITYAPEAAGDDLPQLLNLLWGNVSLKDGVLLERLELPPGLLERYSGPRFGISGIRGACGAEASRPLLCAALKPLGSSASELADTARRFAEGGADLVKDDHSLTDQPWAPFRERVRRCREAVEEANARTGGETVYVPHLTGDPGRMGERAAFVREEGCRGGLVNAVPGGLPALGEVAAAGLFVLAHPSLAGGFFRADHGIAPDVLLGTLFRLAGADGVIYPNAGGRFPFPEERCRAINGRLREPLGRLRPAFPVPGGGIDVERIPGWAAAYGPDTVFLVGGSLYARPDLTEATRRLADALEGAQGP